MCQKRVRTIEIVTVALAVAWLASLASMPANGQAAPADKKAAPKPVMPSKTPDGQPDIQGIYARRGVHGLASYERESNGPQGKEDPLEDAGFSRPPDGERVRYNNGEAGNQNFNQGGAVGPVSLAGPPPAETPRFGLIDPPNKILPWIPEEDKKRREFLMHTSPPASLRYVEYDARCTLPGLFLNGGPFEIIQPEKEVVILSEYQHYTRTIHLDGRSHIGGGIHLFMGDSIGHWEGNTLIVDTTNFNEFTGFTRQIPYLSDSLHTIERFTVLDRNNIDYEVTVDDPKLFTKPWKTAGLYRRAKDYEIMEFACAEGTQELENMFGKPPSGK